LSDSNGAGALIAGLRQGDPAAIEKLIRVTYKELRRLAGHYMKSERPEHTLQPTALVHEAYLRIFADEPLRWNDQKHFFAVAARQSDIDCGNGPPTLARRHVARCRNNGT